MIDSQTGTTQARWRASERPDKPQAIIPARRRSCGSWEEATSQYSSDFHFHWLCIDRTPARRFPTTAVTSESRPTAGLRRCSFTLGLSDGGNRFEPVLPSPEEFLQRERRSPSDAGIRIHPDGEPRSIVVRSVFAMGRLSPSFTRNFARGLPPRRRGQ